MTGEDVLTDVMLIDLTYRDSQFVRAELAEKIDAAIAAAVAAEREACAKVCDDETETGEYYAAAIRARK